MGIGDGYAKLYHWLLVLIVRGFGGVAGVVATIVTSRMLGAEQAGLVFLALSVITVSAAFSRLGLDMAVVRFIGMHAASGEWAQVQGTFRLSLKWAGFTSLAVALLLCLAAGPLAHHVFHKPALAPVLTIMAWQVPLLALYWLCAQGFIGLRQPELATFLQNICLPLGFIALLLAALHLDLPLPPALLAACAYVLGASATLLMGLWLWRKRLPAATPHIDATQLWNSAAPLWVVVVMNQMLTWSGQITSGIWLDATQVAHFAAAQRTALLISLALIVTNMLVAPRFAALHKQDKLDDLRQLARKTTQMMALIATFVVIAMVVFANEVMQLFGEEFGNAGVLLKILALGQWVCMVTGSVAILLQMTGYERDMRDITIASGVLVIALSVIFTSRWGVQGAAWATALTMIAQNIAALIMVRRRLGFWTLGL